MKTRGILGIGNVLRFLTSYTVVFANNGNDISVLRGRDRLENYFYDVYMNWDEVERTRGAKDAECESCVIN